MTIISHYFRHFKVTPLEIKGLFATKGQKFVKIDQQSAEVGLGWAKQDPGGEGE